MVVENLMQLKDIVLRDRYRFKALMDYIQYISIAGDFLLITVPWRSFFFDKLPDAGVRGNNPLDSIRCLCTLNFGNLNKLLDRKSVV